MKNFISELILFDEKGLSGVAFFYNNDPIMQSPWEMIKYIPRLFATKSSTFKNYENIIINDKEGPVIIHDSAIIEPFSVLNGPLFVGNNCRIKSHSRISNSIINHDCKVSGEVESSIFQPYSNKAHEGFLGHSFIGSFVNLGAGTTTSNLKNNYSKVSIKWDGDLIYTDSTFFGSIIGDHVKTAIGTNLNTGTVIGMGSNIVSQSFPPRYIPPFSLYYKEKITKISFDDFCKTAEKAMSRRKISLSEEEKDKLHNIYKTC